MFLVPLLLGVLRWNHQYLPLSSSMKPSIGAAVLHLQIYDCTYLLSFAEADSCCFCMYFWPRLFILSKLWQRQPRRNTFTKRSWTQRQYNAESSSGSLRPCSLRRQLVCFWARLAPFLPATWLKSQVLRVQMSDSARAALKSAVVRSGENVLLNWPNGPGLRA